MKICIYGVGAIGGWVGAGLGQPALGHSLSAVARGDTLAALHAHGLRLQPAPSQPGGPLPEVVSVPITASEKPADLGLQDLVIVAVKAPALANVAAQIAPLIGPHTVVLTAMNGVPWWFLQGFGAPMPTPHSKAWMPAAR